MSTRSSDPRIKRELGWCRGEENDHSTLLLYPHPPTPEPMPHSAAETSFHRHCRRTYAKDPKKQEEEEGRGVMQGHAAVEDRGSAGLSSATATSAPH
jgi:hypothetical protein